MLNLIGTDLVVILEPEVIRDYQDILDREIGSIRLPFLKGVSEVEFFKDAPDGSPEYEVWKRALVVEKYDKPEYYKELFDQKETFFLKHRLMVDFAKLGS